MNTITILQIAFAPRSELNSWVQPIELTEAPAAKARALLRRPKDRRHDGDSLSLRGTSGERGSFSAAETFAQCLQGFPSPRPS